MSLAAPDALKLLSKAHAQNRLAHAYLITGPEGSGKRQLALDLCAMLLTCPAENALSHPDVHSVAPESKSRVLTIEQLRSLEGNLQMRSLRGGRKVGIIFEADRMNRNASNAFLKTLEEPPSGTHILLLSQQPEQLLETILSRCIEIPLRAGALGELSASSLAAAELISEFYSKHEATLQGGLWLAQQLQALLLSTKEGIREAGAAAFKAEEKLYKQVVDPKWLERQEEAHDARTEAQYIGERNRLLEVFEAFWTDVLLVQNNRPPKHLLKCSDHAATVARSLPSHAALGRCQAIAQMRSLLGMSGVNEPLALEKGILDAFAPEP